MHQQSYRYQSGFRVKQTEDIDCDSRITVQRMKSDAATAGFKDRCGQQVVGIYQHGQ